MNRTINFAPGEYYHLYNRGVEQRPIFLDDHDRSRFLSLLYLCNGKERINLRTLFKEHHSYNELFAFDRGKQQVAVGAYCLMPNHFHILVKGIAEQGISRFMQKLGTAYSMFFNTKYARVGPLFQGAFKARHITGDEHLKYLYAYIHLNPLKHIDNGWGKKRIADPARAKEYINTFAYSSYQDLSGIAKRPEGAILRPSEFPHYFRTSGDFTEMVNEWVNFEEEE